jgi:hypothetical protein
MNRSLRLFGILLVAALALRTCTWHDPIPEPSHTCPSCKIGLVPCNVKDETLWFCPKCSRNVLFSPAR